MTTITIVIVGRGITIERKEAKKSYPNMKQRKLRAINLQRAIGKRTILLSQNWTNDKNYFTFWWH